VRNWISVINEELDDGLTLGDIIFWGWIGLAAMAIAFAWIW